MKIKTKKLVKKISPIVVGAVKEELERNIDYIILKLLNERTTALEQKQKEIDTYLKFIDEKLDKIISYYNIDDEESRVLREYEDRFKREDLER